MYVDVDNEVRKVAAGDSETFILTVSNTSQVIDKYSVHGLGLDDARYLRVEPIDGLSLFPGDSGQLEVTLTVPSDRPATGTTITAGPLHRVALEVRSEATTEVEVVELNLEVLAARRMSINVTPDLVTIGRRGEFSIKITNTGNDDLNLSMAALEGEEHLHVDVWPDHVAVPVGTDAYAFMSAQGKRKLLGSPVAHGVTLTTVDVRTPDEPNETIVTVLQRARIPLAALLLGGLAVLFGAWAVLISAGLDAVAESVDNRIDNVELDLVDAERAAAAQLEAATGDPEAGSVKGRILARSNDEAIAGANVVAILVDLTSAPEEGSPEAGEPVGDAASDDAGAFEIKGLPAGVYQIQVSADQYQPLNVASLVVRARLPSDLQPRLVGEPGSIGGSLLEPQADGTNAAAAGATVRLVDEAADRNATTGLSTTSGDDGVFTLADVPTPGNYEILFDKGAGATYVQGVRSIQLGPGEIVVLDPVILSTGNAVMTGRVLADQLVGDPQLLGGATVEVISSSAETIYRTSTQTDDEGRGTFQLLSLPTPARYTVRVTAPGYNMASTPISIAAGESPERFDITLSRATGSITGTITSADAPPQRLGRVTVLATGIAAEGSGMAFSLTTTSLTASTGQEGSAPEGEYRLDGLPVPGAYVVTFSLDEFIALSIPISLTTDSPIVDSSPSLEVNTEPPLPTGSLSGSVVDLLGDGVPDVVLTITPSGDQTGGPINVVTVSSPNGAFELEDVAPGSYRIDSATDPVFRVEPVDVEVTVTPGASVALTARSLDVVTVSTTVFESLKVFATDGTTQLAEVRFLPGPPNQSTAEFSGLPYGTFVILVGFDENGAEQARRPFVLAPAVTFPESVGTPA